MGWFKRIKDGITTSTKDKKETPEGLWFKCPKCGKLTSTEEHVENLSVCECGYHDRITSIDYFKILLVNGKSGGYTELHKNISSGDPLNFTDTKKYSDRLKASQEKTGLKDAITNVHGQIDKQDVVISSMNFNFIGGSMG